MTPALRVLPVVLLSLIAAPVEGAEAPPGKGEMCVVADCLGEIVSQLENQGWLGVELEGIPSHGLRVSAVVPGGPADAAGLRADDFILAIGAVAVDIRQPERLQTLLARSRPGEVTELRIRRGDEVRTFRMRAARFPPDRLIEAVGAYVLSAIHLCHDPHGRTLGAVPGGRGALAQDGVR